MRQFSLVHWSKGLFRRLATPRPRRRQAYDWSGYWAAAEVLEVRVLLSAQVLSPVVEASIEDMPRDGIGDTFVAPPFTGLLRQGVTLSTSVEDRAISEFSVAEFSSVNLAFLDFNLAVNNSGGATTRNFDVLLYSANGQADLNDFSVSALRVGTVTLLTAEHNKDYRLEVSNAVGSLVAGGATHIGVRVDPVNDSFPSIYRYSKLTLDGTLVVTNNPPSVDNQSFSVAENSSNATVVGQVLATEPDAGQSLSYRISAGNELGLFAIDATNGNLTVADGSRLDFETDRSHQLTVAVTDNGNPALSDSATITVSVLDQNDNAPVITAGQKFTIPEDAANGTFVGTVQVTDRDTVGGTRTFTIVAGNDAGIFGVNSASGQISIADNTNLNYDLAQTHTLSLQVSDGVNTSAVQTVRIDVEPLPFATVLQPSFRASIHDQPMNGSGDSFNASPFEGLLRQVNDSFSSQEDRAVVEFDLRTLGAARGGTLDLHLAVNNSLGGGTRTFAVLLYSGNGQADLTDFSQTASQVATVDLIVSQQSSFHQINVASQVQQILNTGAKWVGVRVDPVNNSAPSILVSATLTVNAGPTLNPIPQAQTITEDAGLQVLNLSGITAGGREDQPLRVTAVSSNTSLIPNPTVFYSSPDQTARIEYAPRLDANGSATITVTVTDAGIDQVFGTSDDASIIRNTFVSVTPVNDAPVIANQSFLVAENSALGTVVGTVLSTDPENHFRTYAIVSGNTNNAFSISDTSGVIRVANPAALDFESAPAFQLTVQVTDNGTPQESASAVVTINLTNVNEAPIVLGQTISLAENNSAGMLVSTALAVDPENQGVTWAILSGNTGNAFAINADTGAITVANSAALDFEANPIFELTVQATDKGSPQQSAAALFTVNLQNVNEAPVVAAQSFSLAENSAPGTAVGTAVASDPENQGVTWSIDSGNTGNAFAIDANTGAITVLNTAALDFETTPVFNLTVRVTDKGSPQLSANGVVTINLFDAPWNVGIDINPGDSTNTIDIKRPAKIEIALFSTATFDARRVDFGTLTFGRTGFEDSLVRNKRGMLTYRHADLNGDGLLDLAVTFDVAKMGFQMGDTFGNLRGLTLDGDEILATQSVRIVASPGGGPKK